MIPKSLSDHLPTHHAGVHISNIFAIRPPKKAYNRSEEYDHGRYPKWCICMEALNDVILNEVRNEDFPYTENTHHILHLTDVRIQSK